MFGIRMSISTTSGPVLAGEFDGLRTVGCFADDLEVVGRVDEYAKARAHQCRVVGDEDLITTSVLRTGAGRRRGIRRRGGRRRRTRRRTQRRARACR